MSGISEGISNVVYIMAGLLILGVATVNQVAVNDFVKQRTLDVNANRIENTVLVMGSTPKGHVEVPLEGYNFHYSSGEFTLSYKDKEETRQLTDELMAGSYRWSYSEPQEIKETLCLEKGGGSNPYIEFKKGGCS